MKVILLIGLIDGPPTHHDGRFLKAYDPWRVEEGILDGSIPERGGFRLIRTLETTDNPHEALRFTDGGAALECWRKVSPNRPIRPDGNSNRPLTAYSCEIVEAP